MSRDDMNALLTAAVDVATDRLTEDAEFAPFGLAMQEADGEILHLEPDEEGEAVDDAEHVRALLIAGLREGAVEQRYRAVAIVSDVTLEDEQGEAVTSAIHVAIEHTDDEPVTCIVPYELGETSVELGELAAEPGERHVFKEMVEN
jgi:hypothetical protein